MTPLEQEQEQVIQEQVIQELVEQAQEFIKKLDWQQQLLNHYKDTIHILTNRNLDQRKQIEQLTSIIKEQHEKRLESI